MGMKQKEKIEKILAELSRLQKDEEVQEIENSVQVIDDIKIDLNVLKSML